MCRRKEAASLTLRLPPPIGCPHTHAHTRFGEFSYQNVYRFYRSAEKMRKLICNNFGSLSLSRIEQTFLFSSSSSSCVGGWVDDVLTLWTTILSPEEF